MDDQRLKNSVRSIEMPDDMRSRIINSIVSKTEKANHRRVTVWKRPAAALVSIVLCLILAVPALAAAVNPIYELVYQVSPAIAQFFQPVHEADEDNGIRMEVVSAYVHEDTAEIYITMQDLTDDRIDETTDLYDSYSIHRPFDSTAHCERVGYDAATKTATFLITIEQLGNQKINGDKITFSVREFLSHKSTYEGIAIPFSLSEVSNAEKTQQVSSSGGGGLAYEDAVGDGTVTALIPSAPYKAFPVDGIDLTAVGYIDGKLHIQISVKDRLDNDNHGYFYLKDSTDKVINSDYSFYFMNHAKKGKRIDYMEDVFDITPGKLAGCTLYGNFWTSGMLTEGNWKVTFPLS